MKKNDGKILEYTKIKTLSITVTEEIIPKYLLKFLKTTILNSDLIISPNFQFYYNFISSSMSYEIIVFDIPKNKKTNFILEPFLPFNYYDNDNLNTTDLFIADNYFILYKNKELLLYKKITSINIDDVTKYLLQTYKIKLDNIIYLDKKLIKDLQSSYFEKEYILYSLFQNKTFQAFQIFFILITILFGYLAFNNLTGNQIITKSSKEVISLENKYNNLIQIYNKNNHLPIDNMIKFFKYVKLNNIIIEHIIYKNKTIKTIAIHKDKKILLDIATMYGKDIDIKYITYNKDLHNYRMEITIEF